MPAGPQRCGQSPPTSPRGHRLPSALQRACSSLCTRVTPGLYALSSALLSPALRHPRVIPATVLPVPAASQQVWDKDVSLVLVFYMGQAVQDGRAGCDLGASFPGLLRGENKTAQSSQLASVFHPLLPSCDFTPYCPSTPCPHFSTLPQLFIPLGVAPCQPKHGRG